MYNTNLNNMVINHMHGLIFKLKKRMNSRQDQPVKVVHIYYILIILIINILLYTITIVIIINVIIIYYNNTKL